MREEPAIKMQNPMGNDTSHTAPPKLGEGYAVSRLAHRGQWFDVWRIAHEQSGEQYALKILREELRKDTAARVICENEIAALTSLESKYVVRLAGSMRHEDDPVAILEWLDGTTLESRLSDSEVSVPRAIWTTRQCVQAMIDLEARDLCHGDLRASNVVLPRDGSCKLIGLGCSSPINDSTNRPRSEFLSGDANYVPPESLHDGEADPIARDVYFLGVNFYRMLTGRMPLGHSPMSLRIAQFGQRPEVSKSDFSDNVPTEVVDLAMRLMATNPIRRPTNLRRLARELIELELCLMRSVA